MRHEKCHLEPSGDDAVEVSHPSPLPSPQSPASVSSQLPPTQTSTPTPILPSPPAPARPPLSEFLLVRGPFEECLPTYLMERNQAIRSLWNEGALQLNQSLGDSPAVLKKKMNIVQRRLYIPAATGKSPICSPPDEAAGTSSLQPSTIVPSPAPPHPDAASPSPHTGLAPFQSSAASETDPPHPEAGTSTHDAASPSPHPGLTPLQSSAASETDQRCSKFWCEKCLKGFSDNAHLRRHEKIKHQPRY